MTFSIGRWGIGIEVNPTDIDLKGRRGRMVTVKGEIAPADANEAKHLRNELYRMSENEDLVVPLAYSVDPSLDGYYRLEDADVKIGLVSLSGWYPFTANLLSFGAVGRSAIESRISGGLRANDHSISAGTSEPWHGLPAAAFAYEIGDNTWTTLSRTFADGAVTIYRDIDVSVSPIWSIPPADFYDNSAEVEVGTTLLTMMGIDCENLPDDWRVSNGGVRVTPNGTSGRIDVQHYDGSSWVTAKTYQILVGGSEVGQWDGFSIMRNDAAVTIVRLFRDTAGGPTYLDLTMRRGSRYIEGRLSRPVSSTFKVVLDTAEASTAITGAIHKTTNDGDGNRHVLGSSKSVTNDLTNGGIEKASVTTFDFFIGSEIGGSGAVAGDTAADLVNQYHGYVTETLNPVRRR